MKINNTQKKHPAFGWHYKMHTAMVKKSAEGFDIAAKYLAKLAKSVQKPDFYEGFLLGQKHLYFPNAKMKSYLDYTGTHNAKHMFLKHIKKMDIALKKNKLTKAFGEAGQALHYLQDITQPLHLKEGTFLQKAKEFINPHLKFEIQMHIIENELYQKARPIKIKAENFKELFEKTIKVSLKNKIPSSKNSNKWTPIGQYAINLSIGATKKFLELLLNSINT